jgi:hypothetical protein
MTQAEKLWNEAKRLEADFERLVLDSAMLARHIAEERAQVRALAREMRKEAEHLHAKLSLTRN